MFDGSGQKEEYGRDGKDFPWILLDILSVVDWIFDEVFVRVVSYYSLPFP